MTDEELLTKAVAFELLSYNPDDKTVPIGRIRELKVERRTAANDATESWAIINGNECLSHKGQWEYEPRPSSRTDSFLKRCRWSSLREAIKFAETHLRKYPLGFKPPKDKAELADLMMTREDIEKRKHVETLSEVIRRMKAEKAQDDQNT